MNGSINPYVLRLLYTDLRIIFSDNITNRALCVTIIYSIFFTTVLMPNSVHSGTESFAAASHTEIEMVFFYEK